MYKLPFDPPTNILLVPLSYTGALSFTPEATVIGHPVEIAGNVPAAHLNVQVVL
jgi:hypothetical protein